MEQINGGILKLMNIPAGAHINAGKTDFGASRGEQVFDALLEQKAGEARSEVVNDKSEKRKTPERDEKREDIVVDKQDRPVREEEEETCDIAKEAASSQIVWLVQGNAGELLVEQQEPVVTIEIPTIFALNDEPVQGEAATLLSQLTGAPQTTAEEPVGELIPTGEEGFSLETAAEIETAVEDVQPDADTAGNSLEGFDKAIHVKRNDGEEGNEEAVEGTPLFDKVEAAPVKVAEAPERARESENVTEQVTVKLDEMLASGETRLELQLEPLELGKLTIELTQSADGSVSILLNAENADTRGLLERHIHNLQEALTERGQQSVQITVERGEEAQRQDNQQRDDFRDDGNGRQQEQQHSRDHRSHGDDFLQQLRLGLIPIEEEDET